MNGRDPNDDRIERAIDGLLSAADWQALQDDIVRDPALRERYVRRVWLHAQLRAQGPQLFEGKAPEVAAEKPRLRQLAWGAAIAASLIAGLWLAGGRWTKRVPVPVATLVDTSNCKWAGSDLPTKLNAQLSAGTLALVEGVATLKFVNGAKLTIEAPTTLEIVNAMHCRLLEGSVVAEVPDAAHGFVVDTRDLKVKDLGTRFGLTTGASGNSQVIVLEGEIEIAGKTVEGRKRLTTGKGFHVGSGNVPVTGEPQRFKQLSKAAGWTLIPTSFGRGKDGYARRGDVHGPTGRHPLIMVKHTDLPQGRPNERRGYMTFDLSGIDARKVTEAELVLTPMASGLGFSAMIPDSDFSIYAITDESQDEWDEDTMLWTNAPVGTDDSLIAMQVRKVGEFTIQRGGVAGPIVVQTSALAEFIRSDTNGLVSFVLVRETGETAISGLVHAFAAKESLTGVPPTLRVR